MEVIMMKVISKFGLILVCSIGAATADQIQLTPTVQGAANDQGPQDGTFDTISPAPNDRNLFNNGWQQNRYAFEFDTSTVPSGSEILSAELQVCIGVWFDPWLPDQQDPQVREIELHGYEGNGLQELTDYRLDGLIENKILQPTGNQQVTYDVSDRISWATGYAGFNLREIFTPGHDTYLDMFAAEPCIQQSPPLRLVVVYSNTLPVSIDLKPGNDTNTVNIGSAGVVPIAILSADDFDAGSINPESIYLSGATVRLAGKSGNGMCYQQDVDDNGLLDLVCNVETAQFLIEPGDDIVKLTAETVDGVKVEGSDFVRIVP
jgi:hypothetical protein